MSGVFDSRICDLGEGPLWNRDCGQLFWFDITGKRLLTQTADGPKEWAFHEMVSAAGLVDATTLLIGSETALFRFDTSTGIRTDLCTLEADRPANRSNDGRADPQGGFWIGTMGKAANPGAGAIYRYHKGEVRTLFPGLSIPNAICFAPDGTFAHFADSARRLVWRISLDGEGWPKGVPEIFLDLSASTPEPDGAVMDADGLLWLALWGAGMVAAFAPDGTRVRIVEFDAPHTSCPAFGGADNRTLFCTSARHYLTVRERLAHPDSGKTFARAGVARGQYEHKVIL